MYGFTALYWKCFFVTGSALRKQCLCGVPPKGVCLCYCFRYPESMETKLRATLMSDFTCCKVFLHYVLRFFWKREFETVKGSFPRPLRLCWSALRMNFQFAHLSAAQVSFRSLWLSLFSYIFKMWIVCEHLMEECARNLYVCSIYMYVSGYIYVYTHADRDIYYFDICNITEVILCEA